MKAVRAIFFSWLPLAGATTGILLIAYAGIQQNYRQSLNDPQIQIAEDLAVQGEQNGLDVSMLNGLISTMMTGHSSTTVDIARDLAPWSGLYDVDDAGNVGTITTQGFLNDEPVFPPAGAFEAAKNNRGKDTTRPYENRVTWQASDGTRQAIVIVYVPQLNVYAVAGRNMREVENRIGNLGTMFLLGWLVLMAATLFAKILEYFFGRSVV